MIDIQDVVISTLIFGGLWLVILGARKWYQQYQRKKVWNHIMKEGKV